MRTLFLTFMALAVFTFMSPAQNDPVRVIVIGAHPDDCENDAGGTAALFAEMGHKVKFVSVTNGDAGHHEMGGGELAKVRIREAHEAGRRLGIDDYRVLDNHDGELVPSLDVRLQIIREIRKWDADLVIAPRPNDYHPDHRYTGILVQDAAYMVAVPNIAPDTPPLKKNPVFLYTHDHFQQPNPFQPDIVVDITGTYDKKVAGLDAHTSQMYEWLPWIAGYLDEVPEDPDERIKWLAERRARRITDEMKQGLKKWYGEDVAANARHTEAFQVCEYGAQPSDEDIRRLFPMFK